MLAKRSDDIEKRNPKPKPVNNILHISTYTNYPSFSSSNIKFQNYHEKCHLKLKIKSDKTKRDLVIEYAIEQHPSFLKVVPAEEVEIN